MPPEICPQCGASVPAKARACPECGSDEETGWSERAQEDRLGIAQELDYDEFVREEFDSKPELKPRGIGWLWWAVASLLVVLFVWFFLRPLL